MSTLTEERLVVLHNRVLSAKRAPGGAAVQVWWDELEELLDRYRPPRVLPKRYSTEQIAAALGRARSVNAAARSIDMSTGALRKRAAKEPALKRAFAQCVARGKKAAGHKS